MIDLADLAAFSLSAGSHKRPDDGLCAMEAVAWLEGLVHSDRPDCTCPVIADFVQAINDTMPPEERQRLVPFLPRLVGTVSPDHAWLRAEYLVRYAVREVAPAALDAIGLRAPAHAVRQAKTWPAAEVAARAAAETALTIVAAAWEGSLAYRASRRPSALSSGIARDGALTARRNAFDAHHAAQVAEMAAQAARSLEDRALAKATWAAATAIATGVAYRGDWDTDLRLLTQLLAIGPVGPFSPDAKAAADRQSTRG